jgi:transcriptional regulator with XRE-family HTH domain
MTGAIAVTTDVAMCDGSPMSLADRLRQLLTKSGLTQREFSELAGLSSGFLGTFFTRAKDDPSAAMNADTLAAIAKAFGVSQEWLVTGEGAPEGAANDGDSRWRNLPGWNAAVRSARERVPSLPGAVFDELGETRGLWAPNPMTVDWLLDQARVALRSETLTKRVADALLDAQRKELAAAVAKSQAEAAANEAAPAPLELVPRGGSKPKRKRSKP